MPLGTDAQKSLVELAKENGLPPVQPTEKVWLRTASIAAGNWNAIQPYQLIVVEQGPDGSYRQKAGPGIWKFTLPIPPDGLSFEMPFASQVRATMGGVIEENNGAPFRMINLRGSFGVVFGKDVAPSLKPASFVESVFAGTITQAQNLQGAVAQLQTLGGNAGATSTAIPVADFVDETKLGKLTGYFQYRLLQYFLEAYAELKRTKDGDKARLAFCMWKDEAVYLTTPGSFSTDRTADRPMEYPWRLSLKAWKRVKLEQGVGEILSKYVPVQRSPDKLARLLTIIQDARRVLQTARKTILALGGDVNRTLFEPLRQVALFAKDALAVPLSVADLADAVIKDAKSAILELKSANQDVADFPQNANDRFAQVGGAAASVDVQSGNAALAALAAELRDDPKKTARPAHPANALFANPQDNFDLFSTIQLGDLHLAPAVTAKVAADRAQARAMTRADFQSHLGNIRATSDAYANKVGLGADTYNRTYGLPTPPATSHQPTDQDFEILNALNNASIEVARLVATNDNAPQTKVDALQQYAGLAQQSGVAFTVPTSKYSVPFPLGSSLEMLAQRYLGDTTRWLEIAALNGLQQPYVDEEGFALPLLVNGADNVVVVEDGTNLFVNQVVWIQAPAVPRTRRHVLQIDQVDTQVFVTLDGDSDLGQFTTLGLASLQAFLPNTVNSQSVIFIPSSQTPTYQSFNTVAIPNLDSLDPLVQIGGVSLLLDSNMDLILTPDGGSKWAAGLTNVIQNVKIAFSVRQGTLLLHPRFGLPLKVGMSVADLNTTDAVQALQAMFINNPSIASVNAAKISVDGGVVNVGVNLELAQTGQIVPVSVELVQ